MRKIFDGNLKQYYLEQVGKIRLKISVVEAEITTRNAFILAKRTCITTSFEQLEAFGRLKTQIGSLTSEFETITAAWWRKGRTERRSDDLKDKLNERRKGVTTHGKQGS